MKDLKHMIYFEKVLDSACNDLVREAQKENRVAVGTPVSVSRKCC